MGNHNSRKESERTDLLINRCPRRNRSLSSLAIKNSSKEKTISKTHAVKDDKSVNLFSVNEHNLVSANINQKYESFKVDMANQMSQNSKVQVKRRKRQPKTFSSRTFELQAENSSEAENFECYRKWQINKKKLQETNKSDEQKNELIFGIVETLSNLEATFIEEKKYERRLFIAIKEQIQEIQRFSLLLDKERSQNKKLLALLDCSSETYRQCSDEIANQASERPALYDTDRNLFSRNLHSSMSSLLLQQKCDELTLNLNHCKAELNNKNKACILSQYKLEEVQGNCEALTKQLQDSYDKIEMLSQEIAHLKQEKKYLKKSLRTFTQNEVLNSAISVELSNPSLHLPSDEEVTDVNENVHALKTKTE